MPRPVVAAAFLLACLLCGTARANVIYGLWPQGGGAIEHAPARPDLVPSCLFPKGLCGYKSPDGATVIEGRFDWADAFQDGVAAVAVAGRWGFIDPAGTYVIPPRYRSVSRFRHGLAEVMPGAAGRRGVIDQTGAWVLPPEHCWARPVSTSRIWTHDSSSDCRQIEDIYPEERRAGLLWDFPRRSLQPIIVRDRQGRTVGGVTGTPQRWFGPDTVIVQEYEPGNIQEWVKSAEGANLTDRSYFGISPLSEGLAEMVTNRLTATGFIGPDGQLVIPLQLGFQNSLPRGFRNGRAFAAKPGSKNGSGIGVIDRSGTFIIATRERYFEQTFDGPYWFVPPDAKLPDGYRWGLKAEDGQVLIPPTFKHACYFDGHGRSCVSDNGHYGIVDRTGAYTVPLGPAPIAPFDLANSTYWRSEGDKWGLIDGEGRWLIEPQPICVGP